MRGRGSLSRVFVGCAVLLVAMSAALLWVPWFPLAAGARCGWTCYVPLVDGEQAARVLTVTGRDGATLALLGSVLSIVAAVVALGVTSVGGRFGRLGPAVLTLVGGAASAASGVAIARILRQEVILVSSGPSGTTQIGNPVMGLGAVLAIIVAVGSVLLCLVIFAREVRSARGTQGSAAAN